MPNRSMLTLFLILLHLNDVESFFSPLNSNIWLSKWDTSVSFISVAGLPSSTISSPSFCRTNKFNRVKGVIFSQKDDESKSNFEQNLTIEKNEEENEKITNGDLETLNKQFQAFREMALPYFNESTKGKWLFAGMVGMTLLNSGVSVAFSYIGRDFWSALSSKDANQFTPVLIKFTAALVAGAPVAVLYRFQRERLAIEWRKWMTERVLSLYYSNRVYYSVERNKENEIDNPDQRIAEDVRSFTAFSLELFLTIVTSSIDLVSFSFILYSIQPQLFGAIISYALFGTVVTTSLGRSLVGLNFEKLVREADFRYSLVRIRENAESIAFYGGEDLEGKEVESRFLKVIENKKDIIGAQRNLEFFTTAYRYLIQVVPVAVVAPQYFAGKVELGVISQSAGAFNHILSDLSVIVNQFEQLSTFSAGIDRLSQFMEAIKDADPERLDDTPLMSFHNASNTSNEMFDDKTIGTLADSSTIVLHQFDPLSETLYYSEKVLLRMDDLSLTTPDRKRSLIQGLNLSLKSGEHLLIVGNSGAGKSSLLRAIAGLWTAGSGSILRPSDEDIYFLPQRPYCALGSLKDQLLYPSTTANDDEATEKEKDNRLGRGHIMENPPSDEELLAIFDVIDLSELPLRSGEGDPIRGLNAVMDWSNILSLGEQQRLAFGRLLVNKPRLVILDEATSALDMEGEAKMYRLLQKLSKNETNQMQSTTYISVGHRPSLLNYHDTRLRLEGEGKISLETIDEDVIKNSPTVANL